MAAEDQQVLQDRYWLERAWDEYGGSVYWEAFDSQTDSAVFIQQLNPRSRPLRTGRKAGRTAVGKEATSVPGDLVRQVKRLESPESLHVLPVHDVFEQQGSLWVVMDPVQPLSLHGLLRQQGRLERGYAGYLGVELAEALEELHAAGIAHGHVDPHNVFFRADRSLAVAGYGLVPGPDQDRGPWVRPWQPDSRYTPPELSLGRGSSPPVPTPSGDLWAMGMILHRIVQGTGLLYGPLRRFRAVRKVHDARPPRIRGEHELNLLLEMLLSPHPTVRTSASPAVRSLRRIAGRHEPMAGGHWAVPNRPPRSQWETLRAAVIQLSTNVTSRVVTAFLTGVLVTYFGLHLVDRAPAPDARSALLSSLILGLASGSVLIVVKIAWYCLALLPRGRLRGRHPTADPQPVAAGSDGAGATSANAPSSGSASPYGTPASTAAPQPSLDAPACTPHLLLRDGPARVGMPTLLEFSLTVPTGHPWTRTAGDDRPPAELMLVASIQSGEATVTPPSSSYRIQDPASGPTAFTFTAHTPGRHRLCLTVYDRAYGIVLQELSATLVATEPALIGAAPQQGPES
ncbi:protein kinase domain-containing protein [Streptomyces sp. BK340]|uniref:protein kinase domain-containing protein n=1 Tax=Streptomyces sp. BK340 TaxID=2572903 RepID=UPI0011A3158D|nr:protein kinase [Streptomyces sp. BK340]TVZ79069.1 protein kinase-like protein [Streptomyces sp. BK340]